MGSKDLLIAAVGLVVGGTTGVLFASWLGAGPGDDATWYAETSVGAHQQTFVATVARIGCPGGSTGDVLAPTIEAGPERIVVTFTVEALDPDEFYTCQGNPSVEVRVDLGEPRGNRPIVDGTCVGDAINASLTDCEADGQRVTASGSAIRDPFAIDRYSSPDGDLTPPLCHALRWANVQSRP